MECNQNINRNKRNVIYDTRFVLLILVLIIGYCLTSNMIIFKAKADNTNASHVATFDGDSITWDDNWTGFNVTPGDTITFRSSVSDSCKIAIYFACDIENPIMVSKNHPFTFVSMGEYTVNLTGGPNERPLISGKVEVLGTATLTDDTNALETPKVDDVLTCQYNIGDYSSTCEKTYNKLQETELTVVKYQWYRGTEMITGATSQTYTLAFDDIGSQIYCVVSGDDDYCYGSIQSGKTGAVVSNDYKVYFEDNVESETINVPTISETYKIGDKIELGTMKLTRDGYQFLGWNTKSSATTGLGLFNGEYTIQSTDIIDKKITFYAVWKADDGSQGGTVTYIGNGGIDDVANLPTDYTTYYESDSVTISNEIPVRYGYKFMGWSLTSGGEVISTSTVVYKAGLKLYAIWQKKQELIIDIVTKYYYTGDPITPIVKDKQGNIIDGFEFSYYDDNFTYLQNGMIEPGVYAVGLMRSEDDTYQEVYCYYPNIYVSYTLTYKANYEGGVDSVLGGNSASYYDKNTVLSAKSGDTLQLENYTFAYWCDKSDGTGNKYKVGDNISLSNGNVVLYAIYTPMVMEQPSKDNQYTVTVGDTADITCQWYKFHYEYTPYQGNGTILTGTWDGNNGTISSVGNTIEIEFNGIIRFTTDAEIIGLYLNSLGNNTYECQGNISNISINCTKDFTISNIQVVSFKHEAITDETQNSIQNATGNFEYYCILSSTRYNTSVQTKFIIPKVIAFEKTSDVNGDVPSTIYQLEGRTVVLPASTMQKHNYAFVGWKQNDTTYASNSEYVVLDNVTFTTEWVAKETIVLNGNTQENTYNGNTIAFTIQGTSLDSSTFSILYYVDQVWTSNAPTNVGSYNVKVTREEDATYADYENIIENALKITPYVVKASEIQTSTDNFTYNGNNQIGSLKASYRDVKGTMVALILNTCLPSGTTSGENDFTNAKEYNVQFQFKTEEEKKNYRLVSDDVQGLQYEIKYTIKPFVITINWDDGQYTYNGTEQNIKARYKDIRNNYVALQVSLSDVFKNAGNYVATASFKNAETNYALPEVFTKNYVIKQLSVKEPIVIGTYKYTGKEQTVQLEGVEEFMSTTDSLKQKSAGTYTITFVLNENYVWEEGQDGIVTWKIQATSISSKDVNEKNGKSYAIVKCDESFEQDVTLSVVVSLSEDLENRIAQNEFLVDYYHLTNKEIRLSKQEKISAIYNVKLLDESNTEIQPGTKVKVQVLIPDGLDASKITRILHVHSADEIESIDFSSGKVVNGYYEFEIANFSEFAFVYESDDFTNIIILIAVPVCVAALLIAIIIAKAKKKKRI